MTTTTEKYQGWTNRQTWAVKLWIDSEQFTQSRWRSAAQHCLDEANEQPDETFTPEEQARFALADSLKLAHELADPLNQDNVISTVYSDLLSAALEQVNWQEIAASILDGME